MTALRFPLDLRLATEDGLVLTRPTEADADQLVEACADPDIVRFTHVPSPYTREDAATFERLTIDGAESGTALNLLVRDGDRVLASVGLPRVAPSDLAGEVGYWVAPWARGRGVATRAARAVCRYAFEEVGLERLTLEAATVNAASNAVARRLGFTLEGTTRQSAMEGATGRPGSPRLDMNVWGLLPDELT